MAAVSWLNEAWVEAEATSTHGWRLMGVVLGPREVDPRIASAEWCAWARLVCARMPITAPIRLSVANANERAP